MALGNNPALSSVERHLGQTGEVASWLGFSIKTLVLLAIIMVTGAYSWANPNPTYLWVGLGGGFLVAMLTIFVQKLAPITAPIYALFEGLALGSLSQTVEAQYQGIVVQALGLTVLDLLVMSFLYSSNTLRATPDLMKGVLAGMFALLALYVVNILARMFGYDIGIDTGWIGISVSIVAIGLASLCLILDFGEVEEAIDRGLPKAYEWYLGFGIVLTLVWLYVEILRLLMKLKK